MDLSNLGNGINAIEFDDEDEKKDKVKKEKKKKKDDAEDEINGGNAKLIHIRVQQRNGRKCITTVQGLDSQLDLKKILKAIKKAECCNGSKRPPLCRLLARCHRLVRRVRAALLSCQKLERARPRLTPRSLAPRTAVVEDEEMGEVLQFQGDQRDAVAKFLTENGAPSPPSLVPLLLPCDATLCVLMPCLDLARSRTQRSSTRPMSRSTARVKQGAASDVASAASARCSLLPCSAAAMQRGTARGCKRVARVRQARSLYRAMGICHHPDIPSVG